MTLIRSRALRYDKDTWLDIVKCGYRLAKRIIVVKYC